MHICVRPITLFCFDIGLPYPAYGSFTIRQCIMYIHDLDTTMNYAIEIKFIEVLTCFHVRTITSVFLDVSIPYLAHGSITMVHDPYTMLTFDFKIRFIGFLAWLCALLSIDRVIPYLAHEFITIG